MKYLQEVLRDRRRAQRGSVLSGVLIIVAFLSIVAGAIMTELSTNFLVSQSLVNRLANEATVNSAAELALNQVQQTPLGSECPSLAPVTLNGRTAAASYVSCAPTVDSRSPKFVKIVSGGQFTVDGTHVVLPTVGADEVLLADHAGHLYAYRYGSATPTWSVGVGGTLTGSPNAMVDVGNFPSTVVDLVPISYPAGDSPGPSCGANGYCVAVLQEKPPGSKPQAQCFMAASARITGRPAAGAALRNLAYFGDASGTLYVYAPDEEDNCTPVATSAQFALPFTAGPIVFAGAPERRSASDDIYVAASDSSSSQLVHFTMLQGKKGTSLQLDDSLPLAAPGVSGLAVESATVPARIAVSFTDGQVEMVQVGSDYGMSVSAGTTVPGAIGGAPFWCHCPGGDLIGVGAATGLYLLDPTLKVAGSYAVSDTTVSTAPSADSAGDWFVGADDGNVYEVVRQPGAAGLSLGATFGNLGAMVGSSVIAAGCPAGECVYTAVRDGGAFLISIDARDVTFTTCLASAPPACTSAQNPRLWVRAEIGVAGDPQMVHITGWSYYSP